MCGRYTIAKPEKIVVTFEPQVVDAEVRKPRYNIAPMQAVPALGVHEGKRMLMNCQWGLVPHWADDPTIGNRMINARAETVAEKPSFRGAFRHHRCLIPADGFYEWKATPSGKDPYYFRVDGGEPFAFAGLYEIWTGKGEGSYLLSSTIITTSANSMMKEVHDRMPVILPRERWEEWIDPRNDDTKRLRDWLVPFDPARMSAQRVSRGVNSPAHDSPDCIAGVLP